MKDFFTSVLSNIINTLVEYGIIKPQFESSWTTLLPRSGNRDWSTAIKKSVRNFRATQGSHMLPFSAHYQIENVNIVKGKGSITLIALPKSALIYAFAGLSALFDALNVDAFPNIMARYQIIIDRSGDILNIKSLPVSENERYRILSSRRPHFTTPSNELVLKEIKKPIKEFSSDCLNIHIEFIVENWGEAKTIYPYVEYKVAEQKWGKFEERIVHSSADWKVELKRFSSTPCRFSSSFSSGTILLAKGKDSVRVRLYRKPWATTS